MDHVCQLRMPNQDVLYDHIKENAKVAKDMATADSRKGTVVICGAGPSLRDFKGDIDGEVWACNSALPYLLNKGLRVTQGFTIDQGEEMLSEWGNVSGGAFLISSGVHPKLVEHLRSRGAHLTFFHNYLGIPDPEGEAGYEMKLYRTIYPTSVMVGQGLNAVPRAVCLALVMGFDDIQVYGADCGVSGGQEMPDMGNDKEYRSWLSRLTLYADGRTASVFGDNASMMEAVFDGVRWHTRPDMAISALALLDLEKANPGRVTLNGDILSNALRGKDKNFLDRMPQITERGEVVNLRTQRAA